MSDERIRRNGEPATAAEWYVAIDARAPDDVTAARLTAWLDRAAEHEPELERCSAAVEIARRLADDPELRWAYDETAALAAGTASTRFLPRRLAWAAALAAAVMAGIATIWVARDPRTPRDLRAPREASALAATVSAPSAARIAAAAPASEPALRLPSGGIVDAGSVAVLQFSFPPDTPVAGNLVASLARDIGTQLASAPGIYVVGTPQADAYLGIELAASELGAQLGVRGVLVGELTLEADRVHVAAKLLDAITDERLWHADYEQPATELAALADEIGAEVTAALVDPTLRVRDAAASPLLRNTHADNSLASVLADAATQ
jgi:TolB-like protein